MDGLSQGQTDNFLYKSLSIVAPEADFLPFSPPDHIENSMDRFSKNNQTIL
jgi:hypothetical protein